MTIEKKFISEYEDVYVKTNVIKKKKKSYLHFVTKRERRKELLYSFVPRVFAVVIFIQNANVIHMHTFFLYNLDPQKVQRKLYTSILYYCE